MLWATQLLQFFKTISLRLYGLPFQNNPLKNLHTPISIYMKELVHPQGHLLVPHQINYSRFSSGNSCFKSHIEWRGKRRGCEASLPNGALDPAISSWEILANNLLFML